MIQQDLTALRARFFSAFDAQDAQVLWQGKPTINLNETKPYSRLLIEPGARELVEMGNSRTYLQLGLITLSITIPKGVGLAVGYDLRDKFDNLFRDWRSADRAISIRGSSDTLTENDTHFILRIRFRWESFRTL
ncbi:hypothetical protein [Sphingomonas sp.]|uniref:hypothetical protein n=1 Tax=Sphingomonas sp. TaxID=28214 RepID=UPI000DBBE4CB|nr:hypothetical protein [Sphingomonas sp.]PZT92457.1 MAG: hypothetical protein DI625_12475 [Sphingomonas sp.]